MDGQQGTGQGGRAAQYAAAIARELSALKQAFDHLTTIEQNLERQRVQLHTQINQETAQAHQARLNQHHDLANAALTRIGQLQQELARVQEQLGRIVTRQKEITDRQFELWRQASAPGIAQLPTAPGAAPYPMQPVFAPPQTPTPRKPKKRRRVLIGLSAALVLILLTALGLSQALGLSPGRPTTSVTQTAASPTPTPTPRIFPTPVPQKQPFKPNGTGPTNEQCLQALGYPCYSPEQIHQAFGLNSLYKQGYDGTGQTIVVLGTGKTTTVRADLHQFDLAWGLPDPPSFKIIEHQGPPAPYKCPSGHDDLQFENSLDVQWAHAIAPGANIILLIGSNDSRGGSPEDNCGYWGLVSALRYAINNHLGNIITISYGGSELGYAGETKEDLASDWDYYRYVSENIVKEAVNQGITILASSGDEGATNPDGSSDPDRVFPQPNVSWPASDPYILAVGGTSLRVKNASGAYGSETVWNDDIGAAGGGRSAVFPEPAYQQALPNHSLLRGKRGMPDVSFPAEPSFVQYISFDNGIIGQVNSKWRHWDIAGGTSASAPCWAGLIAIANQIRGEPLGFIHPALYSLDGKGFHDIISGNNSFGGVSGFSARRGYDLATGWGTPIADQFLPALIRAIDQAETRCTTAPRLCG